MEYELIRSGRKTLSLEVKTGGKIVVRAPYRLSKKRIEQFLFEKEEWILATQRKVLERDKKTSDIDKLSEAELMMLKKEAKKELTRLAEEYAYIMGLTYNRISVRAQKSRWGSCSREKNINFNCLLMLAPEAVQRYVVVHELCHLWEMNHSQKFWAQVSTFCPDWKIQRSWLKTHGDELISRLPE